MKIVFLGSGNVATHLSIALQTIGEEIRQVWSPNLKNAETLASKLKAQPINEYNQIILDADLYIIAVKDDAIANVASYLKAVSGLVVHISGATTIDALESNNRIGVLYPLQTFSKTKEVSFKNIPLCIEAKSASDLSILQDLANRLSEKVYLLNGEQREVLHVAAVFACNFTNHMYSLANQILTKSNLDFDIIRPLIAETADKVQENLPENVQTGPAVRNDVNTMDKHLKWLKTMPQLVEIYQTLSNSIINNNK